MIRTRSRAGFMLAVIFAFAFAAYLAGCNAQQQATLDAEYPNLKGNLAAEINQKIHDSTTQPTVVATANEIPYGPLALSLVGLVTSGLGALFAKKAHAAATTAATNTANVPAAIAVGSGSGIPPVVQNVPVSAVAAAPGTTFVQQSPVPNGTAVVVPKT